MLATRAFALALFAAALSVAFASPAHALLGLELGAHGGSMSFSGDLFSGSDAIEGDPLGTGAFGSVRIGVTTLPIVDAAIDLGITQRSATAVEAASETTVDYDFTDLSLEASLRVAVFDPPLSPLSVYFGVGGGLHWIPTLPATGIEVAGGQLTTETSPEPAAFLLGGARFDPPALPVALFVEGSLGGVFGAGDALRATRVSGGLMFGL
ncbi:MAG: hypothetical protein CME06_15405 [Gemmatimonadetes bacterium]|nr:hypothetical protein [Gemmatimonadota bacterium]